MWLVHERRFEEDAGKDATRVATPVDARARESAAVDSCFLAHDCGSANETLDASDDIETSRPDVASETDSPEMRPMMPTHRATGVRQSGRRGGERFLKTNATTNQSFGRRAPRKPRSTVAARAAVVVETAERMRRRSTARRGACPARAVRAEQAARSGAAGTEGPPGAPMGPMRAVTAATAGAEGHPRAAPMGPTPARGWEARAHPAREAPQAAAGPAPMRGMRAATPGSPMTSGRRAWTDTTCTARCSTWRRCGGQLPTRKHARIGAPRRTPTRTRVIYRRATAPRLEARTRARAFRSGPPWARP